MRTGGRFLRAAAAATLGLCLLANGGTLRVADRAMGEYRVSVYTDPTPARPDSLDVSVLVVGADDPTPVAGLDVRVEARLVQAAEEQADVSPARSLRVRADRSQADDPRYYAAKFAPGVAGEWRLSVAVRGPDGRGEVAFDLEVREPGLLDEPWVVLLLALTPLAFLAWWLTRGVDAQAEGEDPPAPGGEPFSGHQVEG